MKLFLSVLLGLMLHFHARAEILFVGVMTAAQTRVALEDSDTRSSEWVEVGGRFQSYRVVEIAPPFEVVTLERGGVILHVRLQGLKIESPDENDLSTRQSRFSDALHKYNLAAMKNRTPLSVDELILLATRFGRVVLRREAKGEQDVILVALPGSKADFGGKDMFMLTVPTRNGVRGITLMIR